MICNIKDPITQQDYTRDPRYIARKAEVHGSTGIADTCLLRPRARVLRLRLVRFDQTQHAASTTSTPTRAIWNTGAERQPQPRLQARAKEGYFPVPPTDSSRISAPRWC